jgi:hypothetical protein
MPHLAEVEPCAPEVGVLGDDSSRPRPAFPSSCRAPESIALRGGNECERLDADFSPTAALTRSVKWLLTVQKDFSPCCPSTRPASGPSGMWTIPPGSVQPEGLIQCDYEASNSLNSLCVRPRLIQAASRPIRIPARRLVMPRLHRGGRAPWFSCWHRRAGGPSSGFIGAAASLKSVGDSHRCRRGGRGSRFVVRFVGMGFSYLASVMASEGLRVETRKIPIPKRGCNI